MEKKSLVLFCLMLAAVCAQAQWNSNGANIYYSGGNVGIGTTTPQKKLDVKTSPNDFASIGTWLNYGQWSGLHFGYYEDGNALYRKSAIVFERAQGDGAARGKIHLLNNGDYNSTSASLSDAKLTIDFNGYTGIGTMTPQMKFEVVGNGQILRNTGSADYTTLRLYNNLNQSVRALEIDYSGATYPGSLVAGGPVGESASIATTGSYPLTLGTNNTSRVVISSDGNVGVGTQPVVSKLHIADGVGGEQIRISRGTGTIRFAQDLNQDNLYLFNRDGSKHFMFWKANGFVGIGTYDPKTNLHIANTTDGGIRIGSVNDAGTLLGAVGAQTAQYNLDFSGYRDISPDQIGARISALRFNGYQHNNALRQVTGLAFYTNPTGSNQGATDLQERMRITPSGDIGIGTISPDAKLAVKGTVHAQEVKVDLNVPGPDYVFEENYDLLSLTETENYIKQNKHLPEVPSAKEMEAKGINLSEMNMLLLKKVEELTLYLIHQQKVSEEQSKEIKKLNNKIESISKQ